MQAVHALFGPVGGGVPQRGPWHLKHCAHADPHRPAAQGVTASGGGQHGVYAQCCSTAEDGSNVGGVHHALQYSDACGVFAQLGGVRQHRAGESAQHTTGQGVAGQRFQDLPRGSVYRGLTTPFQDLPGRTGDLPLLHQKRQGTQSGVQRTGDDLGAFRNKDPLFRLQPVAQLRLGQAGVDVQLWRGQVGDLDNVGHKVGTPPLYRDNTIVTQP